MNESKKLKEVWKWKEDVYQKTKKMTRDERISFLAHPQNLWVSFGSGNFPSV